MSHQVTSPLPGVFYRKPGPDKDPYVQEGDHVEAGQTIGVVEIMKQFSEVKTEVSGNLIKFEVSDSGTVNPGDVIAVIEEKP